MPMKAQLDCS